MNKLRTLANLIPDIWLMLISYLPGPVGFALRYRFWRKRVRYMGPRVKIDTGVHLQGADYISLADNCWVDKNVIVIAGPDRSKREKILVPNPAYKGEPGVVHIGRNVHVGPGCIISGKSAGVYVGDNCGITAGTKIYAFTHHYRSKSRPHDQRVHLSTFVPLEQQCIMEGPINIGPNSDVALNCVVLPGATIPEDCFVAINSVVPAGEFTSNSLIAGNPAKVVGVRYKGEVQAG